MCVGGHELSDTRGEDHESGQSTLLHARDTASFNQVPTLGCAARWMIGDSGMDAAASCVGGQAEGSRVPGVGLNAAAPNRRSTTAASRLCRGQIPDARLLRSRCMT